MNIAKVELNNPIFTANIINADTSNKKETGQHVAEGVGVTGVVSHQARRYATKKTVLNNMMENVSNAARLTSQNAREATTLWGKFQINITRFTKDITARVMKFQDMKFIGPIIKSPVMKGACSIFGFTMAAFALVTGINKAMENGKLALNDINQKLNKAA